MYKSNTMIVNRTNAELLSSNIAKQNMQEFNANPNKIHVSKFNFESEVVSKEEWEYIDEQKKKFINDIQPYRKLIIG